ncbi:uridine kinase [Clostridium sp. CAG:967]|nr:uridine kinase [Clostridium sp. CAG:967]
MQLLIEKELNSSDKILKPDFNSKTGRELLAFYLQTKFKQILAYDKRCPSPIFKDVNPTFISRFTKRLINNPSKRLLIGISGESASGKSTICREIKNIIEQLAMPVSVLSTDNYFKDISALIKKYGSFDNLTDNGYDIDAPESFQLELLKSDLEALAEGNDIKAPRYVPNGTGVSIPASLEISSDKIIVVEGIATMYKDVKDVFDVKIYIETDNKIRRERFIKRAMAERNQNEENAIKQWEYLLHAGEKYVIPCRENADFVLNGHSDLQYFDKILEYIHTITNNFQ